MFVFYYCFYFIYLFLLVCAGLCHLSLSFVLAKLLFSWFSLWACWSLSLTSLKSSQNHSKTSKQTSLATFGDQLRPADNFFFFNRDLQLLTIISRRLFLHNNHHSTNFFRKYNNQVYFYTLGLQLHFALSNMLSKSFSFEVQVLLL